jgi:hypothetical protein
VTDSPFERRQFSAVAQLSVNGYMDPANQVSLVASCSVPRIVFENDAQLYLGPTCAGTSSTRSFTVTNVSGTPVIFRWDPAERFKEVFHVSPASGVIRGNEATVMTCAFSPTKARDYCTKLPCSFESSGTTEHVFSSFVRRASPADLAVPFPPVQSLPWSSRCRTWRFR